MEGVNSIVVGMDRSAPALGALVWARELAMRLRAPLVLTHVIPADHDLSERAHDEPLAIALLDNAASPLRGEISTSEVVKHGDPVLGLAATVEPGDVLVVGSHKTGYIRGRALSSLAARLLATVPCSVLVIPDAPAVRGRSGVVLSVPYRVSDDAVRVAVRESAARRQRLTVVTATDEAHRAAATARLDKVVAHIAGLDDSVEVDRRVMTGRLADALLDASRTALLLVLDSGFAERDVTVHDVLTNPVCPIWIEHRLV